MSEEYLCEVCGVPHKEEMSETMGFDDMLRKYLDKIITDKYQRFTFAFDVKRDGGNWYFLNPKLHKGEVTAYPYVENNKAQK